MTIYVLLLGFAFIAVFSFIIFECSPIIFDMIVPLNESRPRKVEIDYEYFIDEEEYFFFYLCQEILTVSVGIYTIITIGSFFITIERHACAIHKIARLLFYFYTICHPHFFLLCNCLIDFSYLMHNTVTVHTLKFPISEQILFMYQNIYLAVYLHRRTVKLVYIHYLSSLILYLSILYV